MYVTPAVAGDHVYVGSCSGKFFAFQTSTGDVAWVYDTAGDGDRGQFHGDPLITDELVVIGSDSRPLGFLYAFERESGDVRWSLAFEGGVPVDILRHDNAALAFSISGEVFAVELATGRILWHVDDAPEGIEGALSSDPALHHGKYLVPWRSGFVDAFDPVTGDRYWRRNLDTVLNTGLAVVDDESVIVGGLDGRFHRLRISDGASLGSFDTGGTPYGEVVMGDGCVLVLWAQGGLGKAMAGAGPHVVACLEPDLGAVRWRRGHAEEWTTYRPLLRKGRVIAGVRGTLMALAAADGSTLWERPVPGMPRGLGASDSDLFVGTLAGPVLALPWP